MLTRALIVLLVVLNAGVALWWATRPAPVPQTIDGASDSTETEPVSGVARLQLLREVPATVIARTPVAAPVPADALTPAVASPEVSTASAAQPCYAIGPFANAETLAAARAQLQSQASTLRTREDAGSRVRGWRVVIPPVADRAAALAITERLKAAAVEDYFVMSNGKDANGIALGRYGSESTARQREAALHAAGFPQVQAQPIDGAPTMWLEVAGISADFDPASARKATGAAQADVIDCATLR